MTRTVLRAAPLLLAPLLLTVLPAMLSAQTVRPKTAPPTPVVAAPLPASPRSAAPPAPQGAHPPLVAARPAKPPPPPPDDSKGAVTGLPLPRWAALRTDDVNMRVGPGMRYPIVWVYHRRDLPVEILREVDVWRLIRDEDGVKGWVHEATLVGHRGFVVQPDAATLRAEPSDAANPVALLKPGVVGRIRACAAGAEWCDVQVRDHRGWLHRSQFFGTSPGEPVG